MHECTVINCYFYNDDGNEIKQFSFCCFYFATNKLSFSFYGSFMSTINLECAFQQIECHEF